MISKLHQRLQTTVVYVTHDQMERALHVHSIPEDAEKGIHPAGTEITKRIMYL